MGQLSDPGVIIRRKLVLRNDIIDVRLLNSVSGLVDLPIQ